MEEKTDRQLLQRFLETGEEAAFSTLVERHGGMVWAVCKRILSDPQDAEDAFQSTFLVLARKASSIKAQELVGSWLYGVAFKTSLRLGSKARQLELRKKEAAGILEADAAPDLFWERIEPVLDEELNRLPEKHRRPLVACYLEGKTYSQAAEEMGWNCDLLRGRLAQAREALRLRLTRRGIRVSALLLASFLTERLSATPVPAAGMAMAKAAASAGSGWPVPGADLPNLFIMKKINTVAWVVAGMAVGWGVASLPTGRDKEAKAVPEKRGDVSAEGALQTELRQLRSQNAELSAQVSQVQGQLEAWNKARQRLEALERENAELKKEEGPSIVIPGSMEETGQMVGKLTKRSYDLTRKYSKIPERESEAYAEYVREIDGLMRGFTPMAAILAERGKRTPEERTQFQAAAMTEALSLNGAQAASLGTLLKEYQDKIPNDSKADGATEASLRKERAERIQKVLTAEQHKQAVHMFGTEFSELIISVPGVENRADPPHP